MPGNGDPKSHGDTWLTLPATLVGNDRYLHRLQGRLRLAHGGQA
jgi:hypothetical protein